MMCVMKYGMGRRSIAVAKGDVEALRRLLAELPDDEALAILERYRRRLLCRRQHLTPTLSVISRS